MFVGVTAEKFESWYPPLEALELLAKAFADDRSAAMEVLQQALLAGVVEAAAQTSTYGKKRFSLKKIPAHEWKNIYSSDAFWTTGHRSFQTRDPEAFGYSVFITVSHFGVRFERNGVRALLPSAPAKQETGTIQAAPDAPLVKTAAQAKAERTKPVSDAHLQAWFAVFQSTYGGTAHDTEIFCHESALGMFPDKKVTRDKIRELRGKQKPGPKGPRDFG